jgi:hypothetical protein
LITVNFAITNLNFIVIPQLWGKIPLWQRGNKGDFINIGKISPRPSFPKRGKYN